MKIGKILFNEAKKSMRLDGTYHLSESKIYELLILNRPHSRLIDLTTEIFTAGRSKRVYVISGKGYPYLSNTDVVTKNPLLGAKYVSRKLSFDERSFLKKGMILTGRVGAIGKSAYVSKGIESSQAMGSDNIIRIVANETVPSGYLYAFLTSKIGMAYFDKLSAGGVQPYITEEMLYDLPVPKLANVKMKLVHEKIEEAYDLRDQSNIILKEAENSLLSYSGLKTLTTEDFEFFGVHTFDRRPSINIVKFDTITIDSINAFNYSKRMSDLKSYISKTTKTIQLSDALSPEGFFSTGSFPRIPLNTSKAIKLINQGDIFDGIIYGKKIAKKKVKLDNLVRREEILIAGVGTLGEGETFCRVVYSNGEIEGQLVSGEFIRMKSSENVPSGYLYAWLASEYGFRLIRSTQSGTKQCRPIPSLLYKIPVPIIEHNKMQEIHSRVLKAHNKRYKSCLLEQEAISIIENEIESWQR